TNAWSVAVSSDYDNDQTIWATLLGNSQTLGNDFILSHDGGETWQTAGQGLCYTSMLNSHLQVSPGYARDHTLLISFYDNSLFQSRDGGLTWRAIFPWGSTAACDHSLTQVGGLIPRFAPDYPEDPTIYLATRDGLYASYDDGLSWRRLTVSGTVFSLEVARRASSSLMNPMTANPAAPVILNQPMNSERSATSNATLHQVFLPRVDAPGTPVPAKPYSLFMHAYVAGTYDDYMYRSDDGGATWACMEKPQVRRRAYLPLVSM
ncbi:MAG: exo-alpha-sialidase, partial [Anaerolineae bacterium]|nr:exo-alpha-sialidase [Anaerolineae bacterium]